MNVKLTAVCAGIVFFLFSCNNNNKDIPQRLQVLFLGHPGQHHESIKPAEILSRELFNDGINITYTEDSADLDKNTLSKYDALVLYANYDSINNSQAEALLDFVKSGKGFIPIHCASYCSRNNPQIVSLIGGQFKSHETGSFPAVFVTPGHEILKGLKTFTTFDETYVHDKISDDIIVLTERVQGDHHEPYTWIKEYGKGRVFYTAYGHDERTWNNPGFLALLKNGVIWALGDDANARLHELDLPHPKYTDANIPNYEKRDPAPKLQAPLSPGESMMLTQIPPGFELQLFASEPQIRKPISMNWDHRGRLWVIETVDYPNTVRENKETGDDRIKIIEDTDGDGKADKFTVFADKLNIPTSLVFANDGVIVSQAPYFLFLKDTNGDDKADKRDTIMNGWGTFDTHAGPSNLRYGFDNKIWGTVGYAGYQGIDEKGDSIKVSQGVFSINPNGKQFNFLNKTSNNTWGLGFSEEADIFVSTANNMHSAFFAIPLSYLKMVPGMSDDGIEKIEGHYGMHAVTKNLRQVDVHGGFTAAAGHSLYTARNFPEEYWNRVAFVNEPTGRVIHKAILEKNGSSFKEKDGWNLVASSDEWFGPVQTEVGPDGSLWILDWYNFIIQHNPTPEGWQNGKGNAYINPMRDTTRGRIYKLVYTGAQKEQPPSLDKSRPNELIKALSNKNMFWRMTAQRLLVERQDKSVVPALTDIIKNSKPDKIGVNAAAIHALYTLQGLGIIDENPFIAALKNPSAGVRRAAINTLPNTVRVVNTLISSGVFSDPDLRVRLAAILKSLDLPPSEALKNVITNAAKDPVNANDKWISKAIHIASYRNGSAQNIAGMGPFAESVKLGEPGQVIIIKPVQNAMKFDKEKINVKAGSVVEIVFDNTDFMQHNLLILQQGSLNKVGAAADKLAMDPEGASMNYTPKIPEVLYATPLVNPDNKFTLKFKAPAQKGDYPYICSFPGHWRIMKGVMEVR